MTAACLNRLRLVDAEAPPTRPSGVAALRSDVAALGRRLSRRADHYASVRVTGFREWIVFWSVADDVRLPWFDDGAIYLTHLEKTIFFPAGKRLTLPGKWTEAVAARLVAGKEAALPVLLWPSGDALTAAPLNATSCSVAFVDWEGFAAR
jgi:hypothetical protein